jgi:hypothetical protein
MRGRSLGITLLAIWLILEGIIGLGIISGLAGLGIILAILAIAAGVLLLMGR